MKENGLEDGVMTVEEIRSGPETRGTGRFWCLFGPSLQCPLISYLSLIAFQFTMKKEKETRNKIRFTSIFGSHLFFSNLNFLLGTFFALEMLQNCYITHFICEHIDPC